MDIYFKEISKLVKGLEERNIAFNLTRLYEGYQVDTGEWDAVSHQYSYGGRDGLLEEWHLMNNREPTGYLTAQEILDFLDTMD